MMVVLMIIVIIIIIVIIVIIIMILSFHLTNPTSRSSNLIEIKHIGIENLVQLNISIIARDNLCLRLQGLHDFCQAL